MRRSPTALTLLLSLALLAPGATPAAAGLPLGPSTLREQRSSRTVSPGVVWTRITRGPALARSQAGGRWSINVLSVDRRPLRGRVSAVLANDQVAGLETVSSMARRSRALGGVNGGFYVAAYGDPANGDPVGTLAVRGELISEPVDGRSALLLPASPASAPTIAPLAFIGSVQIDGRRRHVDGINRVRGVVPACGGRGGDFPTELATHGVICRDSSELVVLTPRFAARTMTRATGVETVVRHGVVISTRRGGDTPIPPDGYVLSGSGDAAEFLLAAARPGSRPVVDQQLIRAGAPVPLADYEAIVSGGPRLLTAGRITVRAAAEGFRPPGNPGLFQSFVGARHPRTLVGIGPGGRVLMVTVDGRRFGVSVGVSLYEAARLMRALGALNAINLDGGGSTTMTVGSRVVNRPSDFGGGERPVSDGLFVLPGS